MLMSVGLSPKSGLGNNCPMLNVYDVVVPRVRKINRSNYLTNSLTTHFTRMVFKCVY